MDRHAALAALLAVLALLSTVGVVGIGAAIQGDQEASNDAGEDLTLRELRSSGERLANAPPSVRSDGERMWWAIHWPAEAFSSSEPGNPQGAGSSHVTTSTTVERNSIYVRTIVAGEIEDTERSIVVAYWEPTTREVATPNGTVERRVADVHAVDRVNATIGNGWPLIEVPLRRSEGRHVTVWLEDDPGVRWTFKHDSVATTAASGVDTKGELLQYIALYFAIPLVVGGAITGGLGKIAIKRAGRPPGYPLWVWFGAIGILIGSVIYYQFSTLAELLAAAPTLLAVLVALTFGVVALEKQTFRSRKVEFLKPKTTTATGPDGDDVVDSLETERSVEHVVDMPDGRLGVVRWGLTPFLARVFGGAAVLPSNALGDTSIDVPESDVDELVLVDPRSEECLDYEAEGWGLSIPEPETWGDALRLVVYGLVLFMVVSGIGQWLAWSWAFAIAGVAIVAILAEPRDGRADVDVANAHQRAAWISAMVLESDLEDAESLKKARQQVVKEQVRGQQEVDEALADQDRTLVEEMFVEDHDDVERSLDDVVDASGQEGRDVDLDEDVPELEEARSDDD